jgi:hypothetical protein
VRRVLLGLAAVVVALAATIGLVMILAGRDKAGVDASGSAGAGPGTELPDGGDRHLSAGDPPPHYATNPPASGAHRVTEVTRDAAPISDDALLTALERGDVVLLYGTPQAPGALRGVQQAVAGRFSPGLARDGQAVVLARRPGTRGVIALAWRRELRAASPADPRLRDFADYWLGAGAPA